ncbi:MAG: CCA tRNA nucleotidyltransferase [Candidatus Odinarchaeota archaeon]
MEIKKDNVIKLLSNIKEKITPSRELITKIDSVVNEFKLTINRIITDNEIPVEIVLTGSYAKGTWLPQKLEVDVFLMYNSKEDIIKRGVKDLEYFKKVFERWEDRHAQHPYISGVYKGVNIDIVPAVKIKDSSEKVTAVDRSPLHTIYVLSKIDQNLIAEIRLLKCFLIGQRLYGAEIKTKGFSGYLCELLIIHYKTFLNLLEQCLNWRDKETIILEEVAVNNIREFTDPLIVIDPVDHKRNVASPVSGETLQKFIKSVKNFLKNPSEKFFFPEEITPLKPDRMKLKVKNTLFILTKAPNIPVDNLWGQLHRSLNGFKKFLELNDFKIHSASVWTDERREVIFILKLESLFRSGFEKKLGPPVKSDGEKKFLEKYENNKYVKKLYVEDGRWMVLIKRGEEHIKDFLENIDYTRISLGKHIRAALKSDSKILVEEEILSNYMENKQFAKFLTEILNPEIA